MSRSKVKVTLTRDKNALCAPLTTAVTEWNMLAANDVTQQRRCQGVISAAFVRCIFDKTSLALVVYFGFFYFACHSNISGTPEQICAKFTGKMCLVIRSEEFECQCQRSKVKVTMDKKCA